MHDSQATGDLLEEADSRKPLYADSAYSGAPVAKTLEDRKIINRVNEKGYRDKPLTEKQKENNRNKSKTRVRIEHVFGFIENNMQGFFLRSIGIKRTSGIIGLINLTYNMFRFEQIERLHLLKGEV